MILYYLLITVLPLVQHPLWSQFVGELTVVKYLGLLCLLYALIHAAVRPTAPVFFATPQAKLFGVFFVLVSVSYFSNGQAFSWTSGYLTYLSLFLYFLITMIVVDSVERLRMVLLVAVGSVAVASLYVIREWQKYHLLFDSSYRPGWVTGDPNFFTISALACVPIAYYLMMERRSRLERLYCGGCLLVTLIAITLAASRGGFIGLSVASLYVIWNSRARLRNFIVIAVLIVPLLSLSPPSALDRLLHPTHSDDESTEKRSILWRGGLRMIESHPLAGVGLGNFKEVATGYQREDENVAMVAHNSYIEIAAEMGLPALLVFVSILIFSFRSLAQVRRVLPRTEFLHRAALGLQAALLGSAISITFVSGQYQKMVWLMVMLSMLLPVFAAEQVRRDRKDESPAAREDQPSMDWVAEEVAE
jgi:O-antigen ligase